MDSDVEAFFTKIVKDTINYREKSKLDRKDFIQLLMQLTNNTTESENKA